MSVGRLGVSRGVLRECTDSQMLQFCNSINIQQTHEGCDHLKLNASSIVLPLSEGEPTFQLCTTSAGVGEPPPQSAPPFSLGS